MINLITYPQGSLILALFVKVDIFFSFIGKVDAKTGESWCPDCVAAEPVIEKYIPEISEDNVFIVCVVGDRMKWKDPQCVFRTDPDTLLKGIPTLLKWGTKERLNSDGCANADMVSMLLTEDQSVVLRNL